MTTSDKRVAVLSPIAWRTPPQQYGAWETVASNITEGLVARGWNVTLFASADSVTRARLHAVVDRGYEEDPTLDAKVSEYLHISEVFEHAAEFDLIHSNYDFMPLTYSRLVSTPMLTTIHGFSSDKIMPIYQKYRDGYFVSVSDSDRAPRLNYLATVYNGIDLSLYPFQEQGGDDLVFLGRIHPDKGVHLAIEVARLSGMRLIIAGIIQDDTYFREQVKPHLDDQHIVYIGPVDVTGKNELFARSRALLHLNTIPERRPRDRWRRRPHWRSCGRRQLRRCAQVLCGFAELAAGAQKNGRATSCARSTQPACSIASPPSTDESCTKCRLDLNTPRT